MESSKSYEKTSQFIHKLIDMMQKFPLSVYWNQRGDELVFANPNFIQEQVLPSYFRHSKISSFIRQLNMYGFCKKSQTSQFIKFRHKIFKRGNQDQFYQIKRKSKSKTTDQQLKKMQQSEKCEKNIKQFIYKTGSKLTDCQTSLLSTIFQLNNHYQSTIKCLFGDLNKLMKRIENKQQNKHEFCSSQQVQNCNDNIIQNCSNNSIFIQNQNQNLEESCQIIEAKNKENVQEEVRKIVQFQYLLALQARIQLCNKFNKEMQDIMKIDHECEQQKVTQENNKWQNQQNSIYEKQESGQYQEKAQDCLFAQSQYCSMEDKIDLDFVGLTNEHRDIDLQFQQRFDQNAQQLSQLY